MRGEREIVIKDGIEFHATELWKIPFLTAGCRLFILDAAACKPTLHTQFIVSDAETAELHF